MSIGLEEDEGDEFEEDEAERETGIRASLRRLELSPESGDSSFSGKTARTPKESGGPKGEDLRWNWW